MAAPNTTEPADQHLFSETITVFVGAGNSRSSFTAHTAILKQRSTFFEAAFSGRWEGNNKDIELPEDDPATFDRYLKCAYQNDAHILIKRASNKDLMLLYAKAYILTDKLGDCASTNLLIDALIDDALFAPAVEAVKYIWKHTPETSPLRRVCVDTWAYVAQHGRWQADSADLALPKGFLLQIISRVAEVARARELKGASAAGEAFDRDFIKKMKGRYHQYDRLHPDPSGGEEA